MIQTYDDALNRTWNGCKWNSVHYNPRKFILIDFTLPEYTNNDGSGKSND